LRRRRRERDQRRGLERFGERGDVPILAEPLNGKPGIWPEPNWKS
jgi:hypothetical protein